MPERMICEVNPKIAMVNQIIVSVVLPVCNEERYIRQCIESILKQDYPMDRLEVIFIDGNSSDKTVELIKYYIEKYPFIMLLNNPNRTVQFALNIGIENARGEYIVRLDAHAEYADNYISKCIECIQETGADNVGGPMIARGKSKIQKVIAAAYHSPFALGGGKFHDETYEGYVDTVWLGVYKREKAIEIGLYDVNFPRSEDDEFNYRLIKNGGKIYITPEIKSIYYPRDSFIKLFKQYFEYGLWKPAVIKKHKKPARLSHLVPMCFVIFVLFGFMFFLFSKTAFILYCSIICIYLICDSLFSFNNNHLNNFTDKVLLIYGHIVIHISYGLGFIVGIFKFFVLKSKI